METTISYEEQGQPRPARVGLDALTFGSLKLREVHIVATILPAILFVLVMTFAAMAPGQDKKIRVYVTDDPIFEHTGIIRGSSDSNSSSSAAAAAASNYSGSAAAAASSSNSNSSSSIGGVSHTQNGADPRTIEIQADIAKDCDGITVTSKSANADYVMILRRQGGRRSGMFAFGGLAGLAISAHMKVNGASLFDRNGDMVFATKASSVDKAVRESCPYMVKYAWAPTPEVQPATVQSSVAPVAITVQPQIAPPPTAQEPAASNTAAAAPPAPAPTPNPILAPVSSPVKGDMWADRGESLGEVAKRVKQHQACLKLAADNPSITCK